VKFQNSLQYKELRDITLFAFECASRKVQENQVGMKLSRSAVADLCCWCESTEI
jgi:hypothetical protein